MIIPPDWLPWLLGAVGLVVGLYRFSPSTVEHALGSIRPDRVWELRPGVRINGKRVVSYQPIGAVTKAGAGCVEMEVLRGHYIQPNGDPLAIDDDELLIPANALKSQDTGAIECRTVSGTVQLLLEENRQLNSRLANRTAMANLAFTNALDFTSSITTRVGTWKKDIGAGSMFGDWYPGGDWGYRTKMGAGGIPEPLD